jgi:hypothetical protein
MATPYPPHHRQPQPPPGPPYSPPQPNGWPAQPPAPQAPTPPVPVQPPAAAAPAPSQPATVRANGHNGQVEFDGTYVTITRKGFLARASVGKGEKRIPLGAINSVQWKPPGALVNGYIQFETAGGGGTRAAFGSQTKQAGHDENSVIVTKKQGPEFERLRAAVEQALAARHAPTPVVAPAPPSMADELSRLHGLMVQGVISQAEFEQAKARLLGGG